MSATRTSHWYTYVLYDEQSAVLYVGSCTNLTRRISQHADGQHWGDEIALIEAIRHTSRDDSLLRERMLRHRLHPRYARDPGYRSSTQARRAMDNGELMRMVLDCLIECGPMTSRQLGDEMRKRGYAGPKTSAGAALWRMERKGTVVIADEVPSTSGRWSTARVYAAAESNQAAA